MGEGIRSAKKRHGCVSIATLRCFRIVALVVFSRIAKLLVFSRIAALVVFSRIAKTPVFSRFAAFGHSDGDLVACYGVPHLTLYDLA